MGKKATKAQVIERTAKVVELLCMGLRPADIIRYIAEKTTWGLSERQVENYIIKANIEIKESAKIDRDREIGLAARQMDHLYKSNLIIQDYKAALSTLKAKAKLLGLDAPRRIKVKEDNQPMTWKQFLENDAPLDDDQDDGDEAEEDDGDHDDAGESGE